MLAQIKQVKLKSTPSGGGSTVSYPAPPFKPRSAPAPAKQNVYKEKAELTRGAVVGTKDDYDRLDNIIKEKLTSLKTLPGMDGEHMKDVEKECNRLMAKLDGDEDFDVDDQKSKDALQGLEEHIDDLEKQWKNVASMPSQASVEPPSSPPVKSAPPPPAESPKESSPIKGVPPPPLPPSVPPTAPTPSPTPSAPSSPAAKVDRLAIEPPSRQALMDQIRQGGAQLRHVETQSPPATGSNSAFTDVLAQADQRRRGRGPVNEVEITEADDNW
jgi:hypothetical protein